LAPVSVYCINPVEAQTLHCSSCGAAVGSDAPACQHCGARLATIACPVCFNMMFLDAKFCPHCGAAAVRWAEAPGKMLCPGCERPLLRGVLGECVLHECGRCFGLWVDKDTFERICREAEDAAVPFSPTSPPGAAGAGALPKVRYVRCPQCRKLMNRVNFAECSGVVVDVCRDHGTWFDADELQRIVQFIRAGGMENARKRQKAELTEERRRLQAARWAAGGEGATTPQRELRVFPDLVLTVGEWLARRPKD
jgi:Zn-finger nucleic acid-binding protein